MTTTRPAAVAGMFYPADAKELHNMLKGFLAAADSSGIPPKAMIVPHAGYIYSGPVAAQAYARLKQHRTTIQRVLLLGPSHRVPFTGLAVSSADQFTTPLGDIPIDKPSLDSIRDLPTVQVMDQAHTLEHSLEVQLPFLQEVLEKFTLAPIVVGDAKPEDVSQVLEILWGGPETLVIISSDLSHYHDYQTAKRLDQSTTRAIEELRLEDIKHDQACGSIPINGLLYLARKRNLHAETIDLRNSGDTAGSRDQVVGYGAYIFN